MKAKTIIIVTASVLALGAIIGVHSGSCPGKAVAEKMGINTNH